MEKLLPLWVVVGMQNSGPTVENSMAVLQKLKTDPAILLQDIYPGDSGASKKYLYIRVPGITICNSQKVEATPVSIDKWTHKQNVV